MQVYDVHIYHKSQLGGSLARMIDQILLSRTHCVLENAQEVVAFQAAHSTIGRLPGGKGEKKKKPLIAFFSFFSSASNHTLLDCAIRAL